MSISIKPAVTMEEVALCRKLAAQVWGEPSACSIPQMSVHAKYGGVLLLAFDGVTPIGFLFSFPALYQDEWVLWSHETAVLPGYLHQGVGTQLKRTQRQQAKEIGYRKIAWTFDPLVSRNAYFNLNKLGARVSEYKINAYGMDETDNINRGMETDRFIAVWDAADDNQSRISTDTQMNPESKGKSVVEATSKVDYEWLTFDENAAPILTPRPISLAVPADAEYVEKASKTAYSINSVDAADITSLSQYTGTAISANPMHHTDAAVTIGTAVPLNFESMIGENRNLAIAWRLAFRESALELMRDGYRPSHLVVEKPGEPKTAEKSFGKYIWTRAGEQK